ncbi:MAG TPA: cytochrome P450 [Sporichthya sp.]|nr:cytochrome P450 [Sporichthya sp.]
MTTLSPYAATTAPARLDAYAQLAERGPLNRITLPNGVEAWLVTGYAETRAALNDPRLVKDGRVMSVMAERVRPHLVPAICSHLLRTDGEDHARLRRLVGAAFTRGRMDAMAPRIAELTAALLDDLAARGPDEIVDLLPTFAYPLPMTVICDLLGVPAEHREAFHADAEILMAGAFAAEDAYGPALERMVDLLRELVALKRATPTADLISALVAVRDGGDRLSEDELTSMIWILVIAGHETTVNLIGNGVAVLLEHPDQLARLRADEALLPLAVEELLRFAGPAQSTFPVIATEPLELGGVRIEAGDILVPATIAANRDPANTPRPDALDVGRTPNQHIGFGHGIHHCLGAPLARLEGRIALGALLERFPDLALAVPPAELTYRPNFLFHGLTTLPVRLGKPA